MIILPNPLLQAMEFIKRMPLLPLLLFLGIILIFVGFAYCLGAKKLGKANLIDALKDDTLFY